MIDNFVCIFLPLGLKPWTKQILICPHRFITHGEPREAQTSKLVGVVGEGYDLKAVQQVGWGWSEKASVSPAS